MHADADADADADTTMEDMTSTQYSYHLHNIMLREVLQDLARGDLAVEFRETDFTT